MLEHGKTESDRELENITMKVAMSTMESGQTTNSKTITPLTLTRAQLNTLASLLMAKRQDQAFKS